MTFVLAGALLLAAADPAWVISLTIIMLAAGGIMPTLLFAAMLRP